MASMFIFGMTFYPVFASLALESVFGYSIGTLYVWMLTGVFVYRLFECEQSAVSIRYKIHHLPCHRVIFINYHHSINDYYDVNTTMASINIIIAILITMNISRRRRRRRRSMTCQNCNWTEVIQWSSKSIK